MTIKKPAQKVIQKPQEEVPFEFEVVRATPAEIEDVLQSIAANTEFRLPAIKFQDAAKFTIDEEEVDLECIILGMSNFNSYFPNGYQKGVIGVPECYSSDGVVPSPNAAMPKSETCAECPLNEFGTAPQGKGKACKNKRILYVLLPGMILPVMLAVPPASLGALKKYLALCTVKAGSFRNVYTKIEIDDKKYVFKTIKKLEEKDRESVRDINSKLLPIIMDASKKATNIEALEESAEEQALVEEDLPY